MQMYKVILNGKQYSDLERILRCNRDLSKRLSEDKEINGYELFSTMVLELEGLIEDGCSIGDFGIPILRTITAQVYPEDSEYFVRQIGKNFNCDNNIALKIELKF